jgi:hypothetical protein
MGKRSRLRYICDVGVSAALLSQVPHFRKGRLFLEFGPEDSQAPTVKKLRTFQELGATLDEDRDG